MECLWHLAACAVQRHGSAQRHRDAKTAVLGAATATTVRTREQLTGQLAEEAIGIRGIDPACCW